MINGSKSESKALAIILIVLAALISQSTPSSAAPYLIGWVWGGNDLPAYLASHVNFVESMPFDGVLVEGQKDIWKSLLNPDFTVGSRQSTGGVWTLAQCRTEFAPLTPTTFKRFKHNFARLDITGTTWNPPDLFDDWGFVMESLKNYAQAAKEAGLQGFMIDNENYNKLMGYRFWQYPGDVKYAGTHSLQQYIDQARLRGRQMMQAINSTFPEASVMMSMGPSWGCTAAEDYTHMGMGDKFLAGAWAAGIIDGAGDENPVGDGGEYYMLPTAADYDDCYSFRKYMITYPTTKALFMDPALRTKFANRCSVGLIVFDEVYDPVLNKYTGAITDPDKNARPMIYNALRVSDDYVYYYCQHENWWLQSTSDSSWLKVPATQKWIDAVAAARLDAAHGVDTRLFSADFKTGADGWSVTDGQWSVGSQTIDGVITKVYIKSGTCSGHSVTTSGSKWESYSVQARLLTSNTAPASSIGLMARVKDANNYYSMGFGVSSSGQKQIELSITAGGAITLAKATPYNWSPNSWYFARLTADGGVIKASVSTDGVEYADAGSFPHSLLTTGSAGVFAVNTPASFANVKITVLPENLLQNPSFEAANNGWVGVSNRCAVKGQGNTGQYSMCLGKNVAKTYQNVTAYPGRSYTLTGWGRQTDSTANELGVQCLDASGAVMGSSQYSSFSGNTYTWRIVNLLTPPNTAQIRVYLSKAAGDGLLYVDDLSLVEN